MYKRGVCACLFVLLLYTPGECMVLELIYTPEAVTTSFSLSAVKTNGLSIKTVDVSVIFYCERSDVSNIVYVETVQRHFCHCILGSKSGNPYLGFLNNGL